MMVAKVKQSPAADSSAQLGYKQELSRSLTVWDNLLITLSAVTPASSVFIILPTLLQSLGGASIIALVATALSSVFVGFCYAELASAFPITGGEYTWAARILGKPAGFAVFLLTFVNMILVMSVIAYGTGEYLSVVFPNFNDKWLACGVIVLAMITGIFTIRSNAYLTTIFLSIEILAIIVLVVLGLLHQVPGRVGEFTHFVSGNSHGGLTPVGFGAFVATLPTVMLAFNGFGSAVYYAEETKGATKNIGKIIMICLIITSLVEILPLATVITSAPSLNDLINSDRPFNYFLLSRGSVWLNDVVSVAIAIAIINAVFAINLQNARLLFASARDKSWPEPIDSWLAAVNSRTYTPVTAYLCSVAAVENIVAHTVQQ